MSSGHWQERPPDRVGAARGAAVQVVAVASGKGGVGKTNVSVNLALGLCRLGREVMLLDADLGLANVDVLLGLRPRFNLAHVLDGERALDEIIVRGPAGLRIVPAASGLGRMASLGAGEHAGVIRAFGTLSDPVDALVIDTAAGVAGSVVAFARAAHEVLVVVCDEPASLADAYALIKVLNRDHGVTRFQVLANMTRSAHEGERLYLKLDRVCARFLDVALHFAGSVPFDPALRAAVQKQAAVIEASPGSAAAKAFKRLARGVDAWPRPVGVNGHLEFFVERLVRADARAQARSSQ